jgi:hypothetical protein
MNEYVDPIEINIKNASLKVKEMLIKYYTNKVGIIFSVQAIEILLSDEDHSWGEFEDIYDFTNGVTSIDTYDRDLLNEWLWYRLMGTIMPMYTNKNDIEKLQLAVSGENWKDRLFTRPNFKG